MGQIIDTTYGALTAKLDWKIYEASKKWYEGLLKEHFPGMDFVLCFPAFATGVPDRSMLDDRISISLGKPADDLDVDVEIRDKDLKSLGMRLEGLIAVEQPKSIKASSPEDYLSLPEERIARIKTLIKARDFLKEKGYEGKFGVEKPYMGYLYVFSGDGSKERVAGFLRGLIEASKK